ncbi:MULTISPECIES: hypothetical protein [Tenacibaculum]|uniref:hypothetical protein n=1 Tax=Tenacibaculum TaxID=104267 RepID=UPI0008964C10|nr:hypothetical protein [Tenacibaculum sp. MAR_2010_89]SED37631.1 hypothetical protein SAMN04487765_0032 [Tenacibaculum sp. MAR_2010_89]
MKKSILNFKGSKQLSKSAQKSIQGGGRPRCYSDRDCFLATGDITDKCINNYCFFF